MGADVEMKDGDKKKETKEEEKKDEPVKALDVLEVVRNPDPPFFPAPGPAPIETTRVEPRRLTSNRSRSPDPQLFENVALLEKSAASKGEPRFVAKVLRQVRRARHPVPQTALSARSARSRAPLPSPDPPRDAPPDADRTPS